MLDVKGKYCIIRTYSAGVFAAVVADYDPSVGVAHLLNARQLYHWRVLNLQGISLRDLVVYGTDKEFTKLTSEVPEQLVSEVIEILPVSDEREEQLRTWPVYKP